MDDDQLPAQVLLVFLQDHRLLLSEHLVVSLGPGIGNLGVTDVGHGHDDEPRLDGNDGAGLPDLQGGDGVANLWKIVLSRMVLIVGVLFGRLGGNGTGRDLIELRATGDFGAGSLGRGLVLEEDRRGLPFLGPVP